MENKSNGGLVGLILLGIIAGTAIFNTSKNMELERKYRPCVDVRDISIQIQEYGNPRDYFKGTCDNYREQD